MSVLYLLPSEASHFMSHYQTAAAAIMSDTIVLTSGKFKCQKMLFTFLLF